MNQLPIYNEVLDYLKKNNMKAYRFGQMIGNPNLVKQLKNGADIRVSTLDKIRQYLDNNQ